MKVHSKKNGTQTLRCSANHTHYTDGGFKKSFELTTQDKMLQKEFVLTKEQRSAVAATLLGDGSTSRSPKGSPRLIYRHGESQVDYLNLKRRIWSNLANPIKRNTNSGFTGQSMVSFEVSMIPELSEILIVD